MNVLSWLGLGSSRQGVPAVGAALPAELLRKVRQIELTTDRLVQQGLAGDYHSVFRGRGVEFAEVRPYQPGDDVRTLDWNVTARLGQAYVKRFVEERDLTVFLAVDVSGSLGFGSRAILKRELAAEIAALLSFTALRNSDRVGAGLVSSRLELLLPPQRRRNHVLRLVREILAWPAGGTTDLEAGLAEVLTHLKRRSVLFVLSDFLDTPYEGALKAAANRHDTVILELVDPRDDQLPATGPVLLRDAETGRLGVVHGRRLGRRHAARRLEQRQRLRQLTRRLGLDHVELHTDRPYLPALLEFFERRRRRMRR